MTMRKRTLKSGALRWDVEVYVGGGLKKLNQTFRTEKAARKWTRAQEDRKDDGEEPMADRRPLAQYLTEWLALKASGAVPDRNGRQRIPGPRTMADYRRLVADWIVTPKHPELPKLGRQRVDKLHQKVLTKFYEAMQTVTTAGTMKKLNTLLGQAFYELQRNDTLKKNPAEFAAVPLADTKDDDDDSSAQAMNEEQAPRFLSAARGLADEQEAAAAEAVIPERCYAALFHVLLCGGLRPGEALALHWTDVTDVGRAVQVRQALVRVRGVTGYQLCKPKTKKSRRTVSLPEPAWQELQRWRVQQKRQRMLAGAAWQDLGFVFTCSNGGPLHPHNLRRAFERVSAKADLGTWGPAPERQHPTGPVAQRSFIPAFRLYDLRHTCATLLLAHGVPVNVVADLLGHEKASFTIMQYGHALPTQCTEATHKLETLLFRIA